MGMGIASGNQTWLAGKSFIYLLVLSREWMGMGEWGNGGMGEWGNGGMG